MNMYLWTIIYGILCVGFLCVGKLAKDKDMRRLGYEYAAMAGVIALMLFFAKI